MVNKWQLHPISIKPDYHEEKFAPVWRFLAFAIFFTMISEQKEKETRVWDQEKSQQTEILIISYT